MIFQGSDTKNQFCKWLINETHTDVTAIAHNGRHMMLTFCTTI